MTKRSPAQWTVEAAHPSGNGYLVKLVSSGSYNPTEWSPKRGDVLALQTEGLIKLKRVVDRQAEDAGLWAPTRNIHTAYVQQELRKLHAAIESDTNDPY